MMISKKRQIYCLLFAFVLCSEAAFSAESFPSAEEKAQFAEMIVAVTTGTPPPAKVKQWFRLISMEPNPPGGPKLYFMKMPARKPFFDRFTYDVQVAPTQYQALLRAAQSFGCDRKLRFVLMRRGERLPYTEPLKYPAIRLSVHGDGTTREVCQITYGKACAYLNSVENLPGAGWSKSIHESLALLRKASHC